MKSWKELYRLPLPDTFPPHPRVFCTTADLERVQADLRRGDDYTREVVQSLVASADFSLASGSGLAISGKPDKSDLNKAATLAKAYAVSGERRFGVAAARILAEVSLLVPGLKRTRNAGLITSRTLEEGPVAINYAMAYDLIAGGDFLSSEEDDAIKAALRKIAWDTGHRCNHRNSSNWRSWGLAIVASCGFAIGDRELVDEAVNGVWDETRKCYLYGAVQQISHSIFSDGVHWERCMGYTYYTGSALMYVLVAAKNSGMDIWQAEIPGILGPFVGSAPHEEYGPAGTRSFKAFLDAPFYYAFPGGGLACVGDSGTREIRYHPMYELGWKEYHDPKYAWLIRRERKATDDAAPRNWSVWYARGRGKCWAAEGGEGIHLETKENERIALVQNVLGPVAGETVFTARIKAVAMNGGKAHLRVNVGKKAYFSESVTEVGDWREVRVEVPGGDPDNGRDSRSFRLHVFLENGAGEVVWDTISATNSHVSGNLIRNGKFVPGKFFGRKMKFWDLIHGVPVTPEGEYDLREDARIGISGRHENGCTLFPVGGFAILRAKADDPEALAVNLSYGPYGSGHDHPDRLTIDVHGLGEILCPDAGSWGYSNPMQLSWCNQTVAHNTLSVDEVAQEPQRRSKGIWTGERGDQRVYGELQRFQPGETLKAVRVTCDTAEPGVRLDRTVCLFDGILLDVYRATSETEHTYDLPLHCLGTVGAEFPVRELAENPFHDALGYNHFSEIRHALPPAGALRVTFSKDDKKLSVIMLQPKNGEVYLLKDPARDAARATSCLLARRRGTKALFIRCLEAYREGKPRLRDLRARKSSAGLEIEIDNAGKVHTIRIPSALKDEITLGSR